MYHLRLKNRYKIALSNHFEGENNHLRRVLHRNWPVLCYPNPSIQILLNPCGLCDTQQYLSAGSLSVAQQEKN